MSTETIVSTQPKPNGAREPSQQGQPLALLSPSGLVTILVPCCGQLEFTKLLVPSVLHHSRQPFELIFLDIGSLDGTAEYLAGLAAGASVRVEVVRADTDLGISDAIDNALKLARGEYLVLLNNDTIVTEGWLSQLVSLAKLSPGIGLVGPMSNQAAPPQLLEEVPYRIRGQGTGGKSLEAVDEFARNWREDHKGKWGEVERLGGFCLLIKREVLKRIGHLKDEPWDLGIFDTDLLSTKARMAGFTLAVCRDVYVHHFATRTFAQGAPA